jgi:hypothetical protein
MTHHAHLLVVLFAVPLQQIHKPAMAFVPQCLA